MKTLDQGEYHATRQSHVRRPTAPAGRIHLLASLITGNDTAFFHVDSNGNVWMTPAKAMLTRGHIYYCANVNHFWATAYGGQWGRRMKPAGRYQAEWEAYYRKRQREAVTLR